MAAHAKTETASEQKSTPTSVLDITGRSFTLDGNIGWFNIYKKPATKNGKEFDAIGGVFDPVMAAAVVEGLDLYHRANVPHPLLAGKTRRQCVDFALNKQNRTKGFRGAMMLVGSDEIRIDTANNSPGKIFNHRNGEGKQLGHLMPDRLKESLKNAGRMFVALSPGEADGNYLRMILGSTLDVLPIYSVYFENMQYVYDATLTRLGTWTPVLRPTILTSKHPNVVRQAFGHVAYMSWEQRRKYHAWRDYITRSSVSVYNRIHANCTFNGVANGKLSPDAHVSQVRSSMILSEEGSDTPILFNEDGQQDCWARIACAFQTVSDSKKWTKVFPSNVSDLIDGAQSDIAVHRVIAAFANQHCSRGF